MKRGMIRITKVAHQKYPGLVRELYRGIKFKVLETLEDQDGTLHVSGTSELFEELKEEETTPEYKIAVQEFKAVGKEREMSRKEYFVTRLPR